MPRKADDKQVNVTMSAEDKEALDQFCQENGLSINAAMNRARELLLVDALKAKAPDQAAAIDDFELGISQLLNYYKAAIEHSINAKKAAEAEVKTQLDGIVTLAETNRLLQAELKAKSVEAESLASQVKTLEAKLAMVESNLSEAQSTNAELDKLRARVAILSQEKSDMQIQHNEEIRKLQDELLEKVLSAMTAK